MTILLRDVAAAIRDTCVEADPTRLNGYRWLCTAPVSPAVVVTPELEFYDIKTMDNQQFQNWRVWVVVANGDQEDSAMQVYDYIDDAGDLSIYQAFKSPTAAWRDLSGLAEAYVAGFARVQSSIQGPGWVSFGGADLWGVPLLVKVKYGY